MFSTGHLIWIGISLFVIAGGITFCIVKSPKFEELLKLCFALGLVSELFKIFSCAVIIPVVNPVVSATAITYEAAGQYSPYLENSHLPFELCSLQLIFYAIVIWNDDPKWKQRFTSLIFVAGIIGGLLAIFLAYIASEYTTVRDYFTSPRVWQFFLYHSMVVVVGWYAGFAKESKVVFSDIKGVIAALLSLDMITLYLNSIFSQPVYENAKPTGLLYRVNFFSSYVNPTGLILTEKWQWIVYLILRITIAAMLIFILFAVQSAVRKTKGSESKRDMRMC